MKSHLPAFRIFPIKVEPIKSELLDEIKCMDYELSPS